MHTFIKAVEISAAVTGLLVFLLAVVVASALPRLRSRWHNDKPARLKLPCKDAEDIYGRLAAQLRPYGFWPDGAPRKSFRLVPSDFRRFSKVNSISVTCQDDQTAELRGQAMWLAKVAGDRPVYLIPEEELSFPVWLRRNFAMNFALIIGVAFVLLVVVFMQFL